MEWLLEELVEKVAEYLTPQELAACCAVSVGWRDVFNQDSLWKPHCDKDTAQYLETAGCRVQPGFVSPESEDSTLSPVCRWRLSYMRQNHLHNNWRRWKYVRHHIKLEDEHANVHCSFVLNDFALIILKNLVTLWKVYNTPECLGKPFRLLFSDKVLFCDMVGENTLVVVQKYSVVCYSFDSVYDTTWHLKYFFFIDGTETFSSGESGTQKAKGTDHGCIDITSYFVSGNYFVSSTLKESSIIHIWHLQNGTKLKRVECPVTSQSNKTKYMIFKPEKQCMDFVVAISHGYSMLTKLRTVFYVYSLNQLDFMPFKVEHFSTRCPKCVVLDHFLAIFDYMRIYIYNYITSELILTVSADNCVNCDILAVRNNILITQGLGEIRPIQSMLNIHTLRLEPLYVTNQSIVPRIFEFSEHIFDGFFSTINPLGEPEIWKIGQDSNANHNISWIPNYQLLGRYDPNKCHTKLIIKCPFFKCRLLIVNFW